MYLRRKLVFISVCKVDKVRLALRFHGRVGHLLSRLFRGNSHLVPPAGNKSDMLSLLSTQIYRRVFYPKLYYLLLRDTVLNLWLTLVFIGAAVPFFMQPPYCYRYMVLTTINTVVGHVVKVFLVSAVWLTFQCQRHFNVMWELYGMWTTIITSPIFVRSNTHKNGDKDMEYNLRWWMYRNTD